MDQNCYEEREESAQDSTYSPNLHLSQRLSLLACTGDLYRLAWDVAPTLQEDDDDHSDDKLEAEYINPELIDSGIGLDRDRGDDKKQKCSNQILSGKTMNEWNFG